MTSDTMNPYVGLRSFREDENLLFFGRDKQTLELLQRLHQHRFVAVVGGSGSGKSSLIRAGLIPALKGGYLVEDSSRWLIAAMKPGSNPMYNLAQTILQQIEPASSEKAILELVLQIKRQGAKAVVNLIAPIQKGKNTNFFLLVDQFEELFRFSMNRECPDKKAQAIDFVNLILNLAKQSAVPFYVVLTMRSDFIGDCAKFRNLPEAMNESQYLVPRITRQQLKKIIEGPARLYGGKVNPALTTRLVNELQKVQDELPLLQHAMMRIWNHEVNQDKSGELDLNDYRAIGGIEKALSNHADEAFMDVDPADRPMVEEMFKALTEIDENGRKIRRPLLLGDLKVLTAAIEERLMNIIENFIGQNRSFLIVEKKGEGGDRMIDISHESLMRQWKLLEKWVLEEEINASSYKQLVEACEANKAGKRDYLTGTELQLALEWKEKFKPTAVWANRYRSGFEDSLKYLEASKKERDRLASLARKKARLRRNLMITALIVLAGLLTTTLLFYQNSLSQKLEAEKKNKALEIHFQARKMEGKDPTIALRLEQEALKLYNYIEFEKSAISLINKRSLYKIFAKDTLAISDMDISKEGNVVAAQDLGFVSVWDRKGILRSKFRTDTTYVYAVQFTNDGQSILTADFDGVARLYSLDGALMREYVGHAKPLTSLALSLDGNSFLTGSIDKTMRLWELDGTLKTEFKGHEDAVQAVAFAPDGKSVISGSFDETIRMWDLQGKQLKIINGRGKQLYSLAFAPDGKSFYSGSWDSDARLWSLNGDLLKDYGGHWGTIFTVEVSKDGNSLLTGSFDNTIRLWDRNGRMLKEFLGHTGQVNKVLFATDGKSVWSGSRDGSIRSWNLEGVTQAVYEDHMHAVRSVSFAPDGKTVLTGSHEKAQRWDLKGKLLQECDSPGLGMTYSAAFSPDASSILTGVAKNMAILWDTLGNKLVEFKGHTKEIRSVAFSPDGKTVLTGSWDTSVRLWDLKGNEIDQFNTERGITSVAFAADGRSILIGTFGKAILWNLNNRAKIDFDHPTQVFVNGVAYSPDGSFILTGSNDDVARLWDRKGKLIQEFKGPRGAIRAVAFAPDGNTVLTGAAGGVARLWDLEGNIIAEFRGNDGTVFSVNYAPDGKSIIMGSRKTAYIMKIIQLDEILNSSIEELSEAQRKEFGIEE